MFKNTEKFAKGLHGIFQAIAAASFLTSDKNRLFS